MLTQLPNRKNNAYRIDLRLEDRTDYLGPGLCTWDFAGARLLYTREAHHYRVLAGTDTVYDPGVYDTEIAATQTPLTAVEQGDLLVRLDRIPAADHLSEINPRGTVRIVDALAADRSTGQWIVYSHRFVLHPPYRTDVAAYDPAGHPLSAATLPQPDDGRPSWLVPHALVERGWVYGLERDPRPEITPGAPAPGRLVRRALTNLAAATAAWSPGDLYVYPHSVSSGGGSLWVAVTKLFEPVTLTAYQQSALLQLDPESLAVQADLPVTFDLVDRPVPYYLGDWQSAGTRGGGLCLFESWPEGSGPVFLASAFSPQGYKEDWSQHLPTAALFRFEASPPGHHRGDLGDPLPTPMSTTPTGLIGNDPGELPQRRAL
jgi:hypothetical protein